MIESLAMQPLISRNSIIVVGVLVFLTLVCAYLYRNRPHPPAIEVAPAQQGEPEVYSATVIRTVDDGARRVEYISRTVKRGELRREDWIEDGNRRALILRPDLGKRFLLDLDKREYVEEILNSPAKAESSSEGQSNASDSPILLSPEIIHGLALDAPMPEQVETLALVDQTIDSHPCSVIEQRATFGDGHVETTRTYLARDLNGLAIRIEMESTASSEKIVTIRRDMQTTVSPNEFEVPGGFKKVISLR